MTKEQIMDAALDSAEVIHGLNKVQGCIVSLMNAKNNDEYGILADRLAELIQSVGDYVIEALQDRVEKEMNIFYGHCREAGLKED